ncbi:hypothetical protein ACT80S_17480 [Ramlibacter sp. MAHUQ-53]|uniref:hypothetical protein n=1 Tax=unclassified Ramlibacter TaxID=2617605 RepID=UPI00363814F3
MAHPRCDELARSLDDTLRALREPWPAQWPGLALVLQRCLDRLGPIEESERARAQPVARCALDVAALVEADGRQRHGAGCEPQYHSRLHIADTLVCMTHLLLAQRRVDGRESRGLGLQEAIALLVMAGHDYLHTGLINRVPYELENRSLEALRPVMRRHGLDARDEATVTHCILRTEPSQVKASHQAIAGRPFSLGDRDCLAVMVEEADIMASTLPVTAEAQTHRLAVEWEVANPVAAKNLQSPKARLFFLEHAALFSTPAARVLGLDEVKRREIESIKATLPAA